MGFGDSDSSTHLPNRIHGQLTMVPVFLHVSLFVFIFYSTSQLLNLIAAVFSHLFIVLLLQHSFTIVHDCRSYRELTFEIVLTITAHTGLSNARF